MRGYAIKGRLSESQQESCSSLCERFFRLAFGQACLRLYDYEAARDLTQEVLGVALPEAILRGRFPANVPQQVVWFKHTVRNLASKHWRKARVRLAHVGRYADPDEYLENLANDLAHPVEGALVEQCLDAERTLSRIPSRAREVLLLREVSGLSAAEAHSRTGLSASSQASYISKARKFLRGYEEARDDS